MRRAFGWFKKFSLWSSIVIKQLDSALRFIMWIMLSKIFWTISFPFLIILDAFVGFFYGLRLLYLYVFFSLYSSFVSLNIFDVFSAGVMVFLDCRINFKPDFHVLCSWLCTVRNLIFVTISIKSFSKVANSLIGDGVFWLFDSRVFVFHAVFHHMLIYKLLAHIFNSHLSLLNQF